MTLPVWEFVLFLALALIAGIVAGYFISRKVFQNQLQKNPPINEKMIRAMFMQMGRKPSEAQIRAVMNSVNTQK